MPHMLCVISREKSAEEGKDSVLMRGHAVLAYLLYSLTMWRHSQKVTELIRIFIRFLKSLVLRPYLAGMRKCKMERNLQGALNPVTHTCGIQHLR